MNPARSYNGRTAAQIAASACSGPEPADDSPEPVIRPLLTQVQVARILGVCDRTVRRMIALGEFPERDCIVSASPRWRPSTVEAWIQSGGNQ